MRRTSVLLNCYINEYAPKVPEKGFEISSQHEKHKNFMEFSTKGRSAEGLCEIVENDAISPEKMKRVLKAAADKVVVSRPGYHVTLQGGVRVGVTRDGIQ